MTLRTDRYHDDDQALPPTAVTREPLRAARSGMPWRSAVTRYLAVLAVADLGLTALAVALRVRQEHEPGMVAALAVAAGVGFVLTVLACRGYRAACAASTAEGLSSVVRAAGVLALVSLVVHYLGVVQVPRSLFFEALALSVSLAALARLLARPVLRRLRARGTFLRRTLVVGPLDGLSHLFDVLDEAQSHGLVVVGVCTPTTDDIASRSPVLGRYADIPDLVRTLDIDAVVVSGGAMEAADLRRLGWQLAPLSAELLVLPAIAEVVPRRLRLESLGGTPLLGVALTPPRPSLWSKAVFDRVLGGLLLLAALLIVVPAAVAVRLTSPGPAFFAQTRVGLNGRPFTMYKLRSMYTDAEARLAELSDRNEGNGMLFKVREDPRVTRVGRVLRRLSIDELPQLWNVVRGDMSLVGPRPALQSEVDRFTGDVHQRMRVKPGLTGLWQVSGRSNLSVEHSVRLDLRYTDNWSVRMDILILWRTAHAVLSGHGAY
ncbi:exopolysaccharide biosynthesis polyprenyl glycosylphosphotransferase [Georgenia satyanarayanai]|uniref:Exopolysaccharide biosynthesis polyprenyl glycosylphosphotransferase n=1 Tax=Georgenia satyanarayanai TaxID=860221 RepID=A0A2Y9AIX7_9MICO|nr:sugar transferase [Georgenia satyanarayanai]PYF99674.1 exopolysaccharide biosynthesis polyprenyl glycosylphosphotransferase [Georgenia satyanarayanai]SSA42519.1 exopolysaccharide biosynthesis polyprenyl glycosylphosphotransferase [Georgenia satyanarayanai]